MLLDVGGSDTYHDHDDPDNAALTPSPGNGTNVCVAPKYTNQTGYGQQRDWASIPLLPYDQLGLPCL